ncbi:unnamed protein product [Ilex paraguariensis]|uniref:Uncharacterized protein n=1 Tax=Ilex paraguariensis TaxID=185542 RepID=A0ABC8SCN5_9AQUA
MKRAKNDKIEAPTNDTAAGMVAALLDCAGAWLGASAAIAAFMEAAATTRAAHATFFISMANEGGDRQLNSRKERTKLLILDEHDIISGEEEHKIDCVHRARSM